MMTSQIRVYSKLADLRFDHIDLLRWIMLMVIIPGQSKHRVMRLCRDLHLEQRRDDPFLTLVRKSIRFDRALSYTNRMDRAMNTLETRCLEYSFSLRLCVHSFLRDRQTKVCTLNASYLRCDQLTTS